MKKNNNDLNNRIGTKKRLLSCLLSVITLSSVLMGCSSTSAFDKADRYVDKVNNIISSAEGAKAFEITETDSITKYDGNAVMIDLNSVDSGFVDIVEPGTYLITGDYNGQIYIDVDKELVHLVLSDANIYSKSGPAIYASSASKIVITCPEGTKNSLTEGTNHKAYEEENACIYSDCDLTINGSGQLFVYGYYKDGIKSKDVLKVIGTRLSILAKRDGMKGNDGILIATDGLNVQCENTGLKSKNDKGNIELSNAVCTIIAGEYGIDSAGDINAHGCVMDIKAVIDAVRAKGNIYAE